MKKIIKAIFEWVFEDEIEQLRNSIRIAVAINQKNSLCQARFEELFGNMSVSVDVHQTFHRHSKSWAVISLQGEKYDYIKFCDLRDKDIREIGRFLSNFEDRNQTIDAVPEVSKILKFESKQRRMFR